MPTNAEIRSSGLNFSKEYFMDKYGFNVDNAGADDGYDFSIHKKNESYYVLVKSTAAGNFTNRWLEPSQLSICEKYTKKFLLFLVTHSPDRPTLYGIIPGNILLEKRKGSLVCHQFFDVSDPEIFTFPF